ncbi:HAD family hydrolase [Bacillus sp. MRMR6]|uniref:HAD family hydrolase n=1 Tax=Bacillus sp. MRMR6 TaxID=1928617 RepID=UPI000952FA54|nr:HAD family hydrolase [Bacillus sp. MRMR6]OLS38393.1 phosphatase [Bacillus sp. MRMR6]
MIKIVLFDVDGVLLSEEHYFDASALTVWELIISDKYLALSPNDYKTDYSVDEITAIREHVFEKDQVLKFLKSRGLNANWDMIYLSFCHQLLHLLSQIRNTEQEKINHWLKSEINREVLVDMGKVLKDYEVKPDFTIFVDDFKRSSAMKEELFNYINVLAKEKLGVETDIFKGKGTLWSVCEHVSQEWYVGDEHVLESTGRPSVQLGKKGFLANETTLAPANELEGLFEYLTAAGLQIGIGTGRPELETIQPFHHLNWLHHFNKNHIVTADDVLRAEERLKEKKSLSKPHPYTYILGLRGKGTSVEDCLKLPLPIENGHEVLVVGDSLADLLAARQLGCMFAAVLTGLSGKDARSDFEEKKADYILNSVLDLKSIL